MQGHLRLILDILETKPPKPQVITKYLSTIWGMQVLGFPKGWVGVPRLFNDILFFTLSTIEWSAVMRQRLNTCSISTTLHLLSAASSNHHLCRNARCDANAMSIHIYRVGGFVRNAYFCGGIRGFKKVFFSAWNLSLSPFCYAKAFALHTNARATLLQYLNSMNDLG